MTKVYQPKLEELMVKRRGSVDPSKFPAETFELFSIPAFDTGESVVISGSEIGSSKQNVEPGDLLLSKIVPHIRRAWVVTPRKGYRQIASGEWMIFKHPDAFPDYLRHLLTSDWFHPKLINTVAGVGGSLVRARPSEIARIEIPLPPLAEQKRIAAILDKADAIRRKLQQSLLLSDDFLRSVFLDMFGNPVTNPKGWHDSSVLGEVAEIVSGVTKGRKLDRKKTREIPYLAVANVQDKRLNLEAVKSIPATNEEIQKYRLVKNDLLLTEGGDPDKLGRGTLWNGELAECIHQNHIFRVRLTHPDIHPVFLNWLVGSERGKKYFLRSAKQTTGIASINMTQLRAFPMLIPPLLVQKQFAALIQAVAKTTMKLTLQARAVDNLFSSLQQCAFRGEL